MYIIDLYGLSLLIFKVYDTVYRKNKATIYNRLWIIKQIVMASYIINKEKL